MPSANIKVSLVLPESIRPIFVFVVCVMHGERRNALFNITSEPDCVVLGEFRNIFAKLLRDLYHVVHMIFHRGCEVHQEVEIERVLGELGRELYL